MRTHLLAAIACLTIACASNVDPATVRVPADLVFLSGAAYTVDPQRPWAEAVAVRGGRIAVVGSNSEVRPYAGNDTRIVDLDGRDPRRNSLRGVPRHLDPTGLWRRVRAGVPAAAADVSACASQTPDPGVGEQIVPSSASATASTTHAPPALPFWPRTLGRV